MAQMKDGGVTGPVMAIDIGNTRTKIGIVDVEAHCCLISGAFPTTELGQRLLPEIAGMTVSGVKVESAVIAAVVGTAAAEAHGILEREGYSVRRLTFSTLLPVTLRYTCPEMLGVDRLANALYAAVMYPDCPVIIISSGTAIVVDYVAENTFFGGAILPGVRLQFESLHRGTDGLPYIDGASEKEIPPLPASSTGACIAGGVLRGCAAAISGIVSGYATTSTSSILPAILSTGGDWPVLGALVDFKSSYQPDMTLIGTALSLKYL